MLRLARSLVYGGERHCRIAMQRRHVLPVSSLIAIPVRHKMSMTNLYETLGVTFEATTEDIEEAFKKRAHYFDREMLAENPGLKIYFDDMLLAYRTLVNTDSRAEYDEYISQNARIRNTMN